MIITIFSFFFLFFPFFVSYFCRIELFIEMQPRPFYSLPWNSFSCRFSFLLLAFYKNVHLLRLNCRQLFKIFFLFSFKDTTTYYTYMALQMFACTATQMCVMKVSGSVSGDADSFDRRLAFPFARVVLGPFVSPFRVFHFVPLALSRTRFHFPSLFAIPVPDEKDGLFYVDRDSIDLLATNGPRVRI